MTNRAFRTLNVEDSEREQISLACPPKRAAYKLTSEPFEASATRPALSAQNLEAILCHYSTPRSNAPFPPAIVQGMAIVKADSLAIHRNVSQLSNPESQGVAGANNGLRY
jgi:hypothetical protein